MLERLARGSWTPYGHEPFRGRMLRSRLLKAIVGVVLVYLSIATYLALTFQEEFATRQFGGPSNDPQDPNQGEGSRPIRVSLRPGFAAFSNLDEQPTTNNIPRQRPPPPELNVRWIGVFQLLGGYGGLYALFAKLARTGSAAQVNFGVFKGSMPYELHSQSLRKRLFTHRRAKWNLPMVSKTEFYARMAPDFPSLFWKRLMEGSLPAADVVGVKRPGRAVATVARKAGT